MIELLNFSFREGKFCVYVKDQINNIYSFTLRPRLINNIYSNFEIKTLHGQLNNENGYFHILLTDFIGLSVILEEEKISLKENSQEEECILNLYSNNHYIFECFKQEDLSYNNYEQLFILIYFNLKQDLNFDDLSKLNLYDIFKFNLVT